MQFFQNLPRPIKMALLSLTVLVLSVGLVSVDEVTHFLFAKNSEEEIKKIDINFVIRDSENNPLEGVEVSFQGTGAVETRRTDSNGYVGLNLPERQDIEIVMRKEGFNCINNPLLSL